jgi:WD40 repeat protein
MHLLTGYAKPITALAASPDGRRLFSAAKGQQQVWAWDLQRRAVEAKLRGPHTRHGIGALAASPCGGWLASADNYTAVVSWRLPAGAPHRLWYDAGARKALAFHPRLPLLAAPLVRSEGRDSKYGFQLLEVESGKAVKRGRGHAESVCDLAFSPDGATLATASTDRTVCLWAVESAETIRVWPHKLVPNRVAFRPDGKALAVAAGRTVLVWDVADGSLSQTLAGHEGTVTGIAYSPDGKHLASAGADGVVILRDAQSHQVIGRRHLDVGKIGALVWRPDSAGVIAGGEKHIALCDVADLLPENAPRPRPRGEPLSLSGHPAKVIGLSFSPDGRALASWSRGDVRLWDYSGGAGQAKQILAFTAKHDAQPAHVSWSPDRRQLAVTTRSPRGLYLHDAGTGKVVRGVAARSKPRYLGYTPDGRLFVAFGGNRLHLELRDAERKNTLASGSLALDEDCCLVYVAAGSAAARFYIGTGGAVGRWTPKAGLEEILCRQATLLTGLAVSPDEEVLVTLGGNTALVWRIPCGASPSRLKHPLAVTGVAFVPGGRLLTSCYDGAVRLWELSGGAEVWRCELGMGKVYSLAVSPDQMTFAAGVEKKNRIVLMDVPE